ncbi:Alpha/beta-hydrolase [Pleurostoma richardsiae]|uniref:Alpha/beta-hydrolase n=1 Tax=Pleurostoma richardsiae TaxID=41990 RepID=A0AA38VLC4_9PEZI|nr:Alpha/beta-hydrolase [Pleurostoma richardsiae]
MACPDCFKGSIHEGTPKGKIIKLHDLDTYVSEPPEGRAVKGIIVIVPDAFGWVFVNNKLLADHYAEKGHYRVYLPDFMAGFSAPVWALDSMRVLEGQSSIFSKLRQIPSLVWTGVPWYFTNRIPASHPRVKSFFKALRQSEPQLPIGAAGFCWGGKHVVLLASDSEDNKVDGRPLFDAGFTGHPSLLVLPQEVEDITLPMAFAIGDKDSHVPLDKVAQIKEIVENKPEGQKGEVRIYPNCGHGFCVRADPVYEDVAKQAAAAEDHCIEWFNKQFGI